MNNYPRHELSHLFPEMDSEDYQSLVADIKANGLLEPIVLYGGAILDGFHRYRACLDAGIPHRFEELPADKDPLDYVISKNFARRHLNPSQRAMIAQSLSGLPAHRTQEVGRSAYLSQKEAASRVKVSPRLVRKAKFVSQRDPAMADDVMLGKITLEAAERKIKGNGSRKDGDRRLSTPKTKFTITDELETSYRAIRRQLGQMEGNGNKNAASWLGGLIAQLAILDHRAQSTEKTRTLAIWLKSKYPDTTWADLSDKLWEANQTVSPWSVVYRAATKTGGPDEYYRTYTDEELEIVLKGGSLT